MSEDMAGKVAIVTGSASGIGEATARELASRGATVVVADVDDALGQQTAASIGDRAHFRRLDVAREQEWVDLMAGVRRDFGGLNILVNNAAVSWPALIEDLDYEQWLTTMKVNAGGTMLGCKHAIPVMRESSGSIVNISSNTSVAGLNVTPAYASSKGAINALTLVLSAHCRSAGYPVRVNTVAPGGTGRSRLVASFGAEAATIAAARIAAGEQSPPDPIGSVVMGEPEQVAAAIAFLASDAASWINGEQLLVDGGQTRMMAAQV